MTMVKEAWYLAWSYVRQIRYRKNKKLNSPESPKILNSFFIGAYTICYIANRVLWRGKSNILHTRISTRKELHALKALNHARHYYENLRAIYFMPTRDHLVSRIAPHEQHTVEVVTSEPTHPRNYWE